MKPKRNKKIRTFVYFVQLRGELDHASLKPYLPNDPHKPEVPKNWISYPVPGRLPLGLFYRGFKGAIGNEKWTHAALTQAPV
jgi:hypothetical protein